MRAGKRSTGADHGETVVGVRLLSEFEKAYGGSITATINSLDRFIRALVNSWDACCKCRH